QLFFAAEVVINETVVRLGRLRDFVDAGAVIAVLGEDLLGGPQDVLARGLGRAGPRLASGRLRLRGLGVCFKRRVASGGVVDGHGSLKVVGAPSHGVAPEGEKKQFATSDTFQYIIR